MKGEHLLKYMTDRYSKDDKAYPDPGPVVTISREVGCPAKKIAEKLAAVLNLLAANKGDKHTWSWISKEIMSETAKELGVDPVEIEYAFNYETRSMFEDILHSHSSKYYKSDRKIRNTIAHVIRTMANHGHVIIVGRGGVSITKDIPRSLHIHLEAPLEWREIMISQKYSIPMEEARRYALDIDKKREEFRDYFEGKKTDYTWYDAKFNCMTLAVDEIATAIAKLVEIRKFI